MQIRNNLFGNPITDINLLSEEERKSVDDNLLHPSSTGAASSSLDHSVRPSHKNVVHVDGHYLKDVTKEHTALQGNIKPTRSWSEYLSSFFFSKTTSNSLAELKSHSITRSTSLTSWICGWRKMALSADLKIIDAINTQRNLTEPVQDDADLTTSRPEPEEKKVEPAEKQGQVSITEFEAAKKNILQSLVDSDGALQLAKEDAKNGNLTKLEDDVQKAKKAANEAQEAFYTIKEFISKNPSDASTFTDARDLLDKTVSNLSQAKQLLEAQTAINLATKEVIAIYRSQIKGKSSEQIEENLALIERNNPNSHLHECLQRIYFSLPTESSILSDQNVAAIVNEYISEPTIKTINLTPSQILDETNPFLAGDKILVYKSNIGLHLIPASELKNQSRASLEEVREKLASAIGLTYGKFLEEKFKGYFFPQGRSVIPLKAENVRKFFKSALLLGDNGTILSTAKDVKSKFEELHKKTSPQQSEKYISSETYIPSEMGIGCLEATGGIAEPIEDIVLSSATYHRLNQEECTALKKGCVSLIKKVKQELKKPITPSKIKTKIDELSCSDDWGRFKIQIDGIDVDLYDTKSRKLNIDKFKLKIKNLTKKEPSDMQVLEMLILMSNDGRTSGFPSGGDIETGFTLTGVEKTKGLPEIVNITYDEQEKKIRYNYTSTEGVLKAIVIPNEENREIVKRIIDLDKDFDQKNLGEKDESQRLQVKTTYTYLYGLPSDDNNYDPNSFSKRFQVENSNQLTWFQ